MARVQSSPSPGVPIGLPINAGFGAAASFDRPPKAPISNQLLFALPSSSFTAAFDAQTPAPSGCAFSVQKSPPKMSSSILPTALTVETLEGLCRQNPSARRLLDGNVNVGASSVSPPLPASRLRRPDGGVDRELLDKVVQLAQADVKRKKMEVELYVDRLMRNASSVEEMLKGLANGAAGIGEGSKAANYGSEVATTKKTASSANTERKTKKKSPTKKKKSAKKENSHPAGCCGSGNGKDQVEDKAVFRIIDQYQPPSRSPITVAVTAAAAASSFHAPVVSPKPPFVPAGIINAHPSMADSKKQRNPSPTPTISRPTRQPLSNPAAKTTVAMDESQFRSELDDILRQMASVVEVASEARCGGGGGGDRRSRKADVVRGMEEAEIKRRATRVNKVAVSISRDIYSLRRETVDLQRALDVSSSPISLRPKLISIHRAFLRHSSAYFAQLPFVVHGGSEHKHLLSEMSNLFYMASLCAARDSAPSESAKEAGRRISDGLNRISQALSGDDGDDVEAAATSRRNLNDLLPASSSPPPWDPSTEVLARNSTSVSGKRARSTAKKVAVKSTISSSRTIRPVVSKKNVSSAKTNVSNNNDGVSKRPASRPISAHRKTRSENRLVSNSPAYSQKTVNCRLRQKPLVTSASSPERRSSPEPSPRISPKRSPDRMCQRYLPERYDDADRSVERREDLCGDDDEVAGGVERRNASRRFFEVSRLPATVDEGAERETDAVDGGWIQKEMTGEERVEPSQSQRFESERNEFDEAWSNRLKFHSGSQQQEQQEQKYPQQHPQQQQQQPQHQQPQQQQQQPQHQQQLQQKQQQQQKQPPPPSLLNELIDRMERRNIVRVNDEDDDELDVEAMLREKFDGAELLRKIERLEKEEAAIRQKWIGELDFGNYQLRGDVPEKKNIAECKSPLRHTAPVSHPEEFLLSYPPKPFTIGKVQPGSSATPLYVSSYPMNREPSGDLVGRGNSNEDASRDANSKGCHEILRPTPMYPPQTNNVARPSLSHPSRSTSTAGELYLPEAQIRNIFACRRWNAERWRKIGFPDARAASRVIDEITDQLLDEALGLVAEEVEQFATSLADALVDSELKNRWGTDRKAEEKEARTTPLENGSDLALSSLTPRGSDGVPSDLSTSKPIDVGPIPERKADSLKEMLFSQLDSITQRLDEVTKNSADARENPSERGNSVGKQDAQESSNSFVSLSSSGKSVKDNVEIGDRMERSADSSGKREIVQSVAFDDSPQVEKNDDVVDASGVRWRVDELMAEQVDETTDFGSASFETDSESDAKTNSLVAGLDVDKI